MPGNLWAKLERPEYVGENRCLPCTIVNVLIAVALSSALWVIGVRVGAAALGTAAGAGAFVLSLSAIYLRGYLVPGTPVLTKRYFPAWLLRPFGKAPPTPGVTPDAGADAGPERTLVAAGALGAGAGSDLSLTDDVREEWTRAIERIEGIDSGELSAAFATDGYVETAQMLAELRDQGKIENLGATNFDVPHLEEMMDAGVPLDPGHGAHRLPVGGAAFVRKPLSDLEDGVTSKAAR